MLALAIAKAVVGLAVFHFGFSHVSDDDFARTVIAQSFAHAPRLDPSGTSWLPFPFWLNGGLMMLFGRTLTMARLLAFALGVVSIAPPFLALRLVGMTRWVACLATALAMASPWNAWLAVATVPEAWTGALVASAVLLAGEPSRCLWARCLWASAALLVACLSRYEAWPVAAVVASAWLVQRDRRSLVAAGVACAGPLLWMFWNAHAHGSATHFLDRVASFRRASQGVEPVFDRVLHVPTAVVGVAGGLLWLAGAGIFGLADTKFRERWRLPAVATVGLLAFLIAGQVSDGAPTHHPERALVVLLWLLPAFGLDGAGVLWRRLLWGSPRREGMLVGTAMMGLVLWGVQVVEQWREPPGATFAERREEQIALGAALRGEPSLVVAPCAFEHFALIASFGAPERVLIGGQRTPQTPECPAVWKGLRGFSPVRAP